jgi:hypothetical protein
MNVDSSTLPKGKNALRVGAAVDVNYRTNGAVIRTDMYSVETAMNLET